MIFTRTFKMGCFLCVKLYCRNYYKTLLTSDSDYKILNGSLLWNLGGTSLETTWDLWLSSCVGAPDWCLPTFQLRIETGPTSRIIVLYEADLSDNGERPEPSNIMCNKVYKNPLEINFISSGKIIPKIWITWWNFHKE